MSRTADAAASQCAEQLLRDLGISSLPVDPVAIAARHDIVVRPKANAEPGISGLLVKVGDTFGIMYATHLGNEGYERFSVGHELGHFFLPGHIDAVIGPDGLHASRAGFASVDRFEAEADHFSAGLLMPRRLFVNAIASAGEGLDAVETLATTCKTSLTATAIRLTQCTPDPLAVIMSTGPQIDYCFISDTLRELSGIDWIRKGQIVPRASATFAFNQNPADVKAGKRTSGTSDLQDWFGGSRSIEVTEDIMGLGSLGKTLTILYGFEVPDEDEEAEEESTVASWKPHFRR